MNVVKVKNNIAKGILKAGFFFLAVIEWFCKLLHLGIGNVYFTIFCVQEDWCMLRG